MGLHEVLERRLEGEFVISSRMDDGSLLCYYF